MYNSICNFKSILIWIMALFSLVAISNNKSKFAPKWIWAFDFFSIPTEALTELTDQLKWSNIKE